MKRFIPILFLFGCAKDIEIPIPAKTYTLEINGVINQNGIGSLPKDANGYYHLKLDRTKNQTVHRVNGRILVNMSSTNSSGLFLMSRTANNLQKAFRNGSQIGSTNTNTITSQLPSNNIYIGGSNVTPAYASPSASPYT
jgi:hypothetical protein